MIPRFEYYEPTTIGEACTFLAEKGEEARVLAGGTDVLVRMKDRRLKPRFLVNIKRIPDLEGITLDNGMKLGALTTVRSVETSADIKRAYPALAYAASTLGTVQVRNLATVGGNLCNAAPSADTAPILVALSAQTLIKDSKGGSRSLPLEDFFLGPGVTVLQPGELLTELQVPPVPSGSASSYFKLGIRQACDCSIVGAAASVQLEGETCKDCRIVLGAVAPTPIRAKKAEEILRGEKPTPELMSRAGEVAAGESMPITDIRASVEYRREMVKVVTRQVLEQAIGQARRQP
jgi:carbon-monoxide dehydrogenase medium subunit